MDKDYVSLEQTLLRKRLEENRQRAWKKQEDAVRNVDLRTSTATLEDRIAEGVRINRERLLGLQKDLPKLERPFSRFEENDEDEDEADYLGNYD